jgi:C4-dicarboxylate-specific signal transduction histidine kinase
MRGFVRKGGEGKSPTDLNVLLGEAVDVIGHEISKHGILLELDISPQQLIIRADRTQIQQVVLNLVRNGIEAMHNTPPPSRKLVVRSRAGNGIATVTVIDNGPGIPAENRERLFDPFFTTKRDGLGMGLSICRTIIEDHGGKLAADLHADTGTTFRFSLPLRAEPVPRSEIRPTAYIPAK